MKFDELKKLIVWYKTLSCSFIHNACLNMYGYPPVWLGTKEKIIGVYMYYQMIDDKF